MMLHVFVQPIPGYLAIVSILAFPVIFIRRTGHPHPSLAVPGKPHRQHGCTGLHGQPAPLSHRWKRFFRVI